MAAAAILNIGQNTPDWKLDLCTKFCGKMRH